MGGCASSGLSTFYLDNDGDGFGSQTSSEFCAGFQPMEWVNNNDDLDDSVFCESNNFDACWVCDGNDIDIDCAGICNPDTPTGEEVHVIINEDVCAGSSSIANALRFNASFIWTSNPFTGVVMEIVGS